MTFIYDRNKAGLRVKDKYIEMQAKFIRDEMIHELGRENTEDESKKLKIQRNLEAFNASTSWIQRFKNRF